VAQVTSKNFVSERLCPIFQVSNVTGENLDLLKMFMNLLSPTVEANPEVRCLAGTMVTAAVGSGHCPLRPLLLPTLFRWLR
jgi:GTPase